MINSATDTEKENKRNLRKLILSIRASFGKLNLLIAISDNPIYRNEIIKTYEVELKGQGINCYRVKVDRIMPSLKESLQTLLAEQSEGKLDGLAVVTVLGASDLLDLRLTEQKSPLERFLFSVRWTREALRYFDFPIVLWVTQGIAAEMARQAPDFWSWRGGVFEFIKPIDPRTTSSDIIIPEFTKAIPSENLADIEELQQQINKLKELEINSPLLGSLYQTLGKTYFQKVRQGLSKSAKTDIQLAINSFQEAVLEYEKADRKSELALSLGWMGYIQNSVGNWDEAERLYRQSLQLREELGDREGMASSWGCLGENELRRGNLELAEVYSQRGLQMAEEIGNTYLAAQTYWDLARLYHQRGNLNLAQQHYETAHQLFTQLGAKKDIETIEKEWGDLGV